MPVECGTVNARVRYRPSRHKGEMLYDRYIGIGY